MKLKRGYITGLLLIGMFALTATLTTFRTHADSNSPVGRWVEMPYQGHDFWVYQVERLSYPEISIIRATDKASQEFLEDPISRRAFVNDNKLFSAPVRPLVYDTLTLRDARTSSCSSTDFVVIHGKASNMKTMIVPCFE